MGENVMSKPYENKSGCKDFTAYNAIRSADADKERISKTVHAIRAVAALAGLEITSWIEFRDIKTGVDYR